MSLTATTLSGAITATQNVITLASGTGVLVKSVIKIDDEFMEIQDITNSPTLKVRRGVNSTLGVAHTTGARAIIGLTNDFPYRAAPRTRHYAAAGALEVADGDHLIMTGGALAMTLRNPTADEDGIRMRIKAITAQAHTVTLTDGFNGSGTAGDVATFGGAIGDSMDIVAVNGIWQTENLNDVTLG